jgi:DNA-binding SARP family transcriptional activator/TolB-like protein
MVELRLLGTVELRREGGGSVQSIVVQPKRLALLCYLAAARPHGPHRRDSLLALLWPELDADRGRAALSKALHHLRLSLGAGAIVSHGEEAVELERSIVRSDLAHLDDALAEGRFEEAVEIYSGDLLHGLFVSGAPEFERWLEEERARLRARIVEVAGGIADGCTEAGDFGRATVWARRALELSGGEEPSLRRLMRALEQAGDPAGALHAFESFASRMRRELELDPSSDTQALAAEIRGRASRSSPAGPATAPGPEVLAGSSAPPADPFDDPSAAEAVPPPTPSRGTGRTARLRTAGALTALVGIVAVAALLVATAGRRVAPVATGALEPRRVLVLPFENRTLDASLDPIGRMAADWIIDGVSRMGEFEVVPSTAVWVAQGEPNGDDGERVRRVAYETGAGTVLSGSYYRAGDRLYLQARAHDAATGRVLRPIGGVSVPLDSAVAGIDQLRTRILAAMAAVGDTVYHLRVAAPPPTYEAYREYVTAMGAFVTGDPALALRHYRLAAAADTGWAMPRIAAAIMHMNLGEEAAGDSIIAPLHAQRELLGPLERGTIDMVVGMLQGNQSAVYTAVSGLARIAPGTINEYMVGEMARKLNRPAEALEVLRGLGPERGELRGWRPYWREVAWSHHMLGDHARELAEARHARALYPHDAFVLALEVRALAALGRIPELRQRLDERLANPAATSPTPGQLMSIAARELAWHGHEAAAAGFAHEAVAWYHARGEPHRSDPRHRLHLGRALIDAGRPQEAADVLQELAREPSANASHLPALALAVARLGLADSASALLAEAARYSPPQGRAGPIKLLSGEHTLLQAATAAWLGRPEDAVRLLRQAESDGLQFSPEALCNPDLAPLRGNPVFEAWRRPRALPRADER